MTNDYLDTEDQYGSMLSHIDYMGLLTYAVTKTDTVLKVRGPHLVHREELSIFQLHIADLVLQSSHVSCDFSYGDSMLLVQLIIQMPKFNLSCMLKFVARKSCLFQT